MKKTNKKTERKKLKATYRYLANMLRPYRPQIFFGILLAFLATVSSLGSSYTIKILIDDVLINKKVEWLWPIQFVFIGLVLLHSLFELLKKSVFTKASHAATKDLQGKLFARTFVMISICRVTRQGQFFRLFSTMFQVWRLF